MQRQYMHVTVRDRRPEDNYHYGPYFRTVTLGAERADGGDRRGEPEAYIFAEDGGWYTCDNWHNPCGHVDSYADVLREADALARS